MVNLALFFIVLLFEIYISPRITEEVIVASEILEVTIVANHSKTSTLVVIFTPLFTFYSF